MHMPMLSQLLIAAVTHCFFDNALYFTNRDSRIPCNANTAIIVNPADMTSL